MTNRLTNRLTNKAWYRVALHATKNDVRRDALLTFSSLLFQYQKLISNYRPTLVVSKTQNNEK